MSDPVAVIVGATGGLGSALTGRLINRGYRIGATYLIPDETEQFEERFPFDEDRLILRRVNATKAGEVEDFMAEIADRFGRIDVVGSLVGGWAAGLDVKDT
ncbi:MAG: SDR family NAD(P)-dependent oxidoreductase, partial [Acidimicrobiia bacterium]|nr:SDR family NAD(P)-dependent oxidoreductase [Acidimicrobiia bacterium]